MSATENRDSQELERQVAELTASVEGLRRLVRSLISSQEAETRRLTRAVHQTPGQMLTQLVMLLHEIKSAGGGGGTIDEAIQTTKDISREVRRLCQDTYLEMLPHVSLKEAVEMLAEQVARDSSVRVTFRGTGDDRALTLELKVGVFQIVRQMLSLTGNAGGSGDFLLELDDSGTAIAVTLGTAGSAAFVPDPEEADLVLPWLEERAAMLGGEFSSGAAGAAVRPQVLVPALPAP